MGLDMYLEGRKYLPTDIEVYLHHETEKAWLVSLDGDRNKSVWIAKSQAELGYPAEGAFVHTVHILTAPEPLLIEKGLV